jgi:hypothetical protein
MIQENKRAKPGRKPVDDKKIPLTIYVEMSRVEVAGDGDLGKGKELIKSQMKSFVSDNFPKA